jgi:hypothetical protein
MEAEQGDLELALGDVKLVDGVPFLAVSSSKPRSSICVSLLVNLVRDRACLFVLTEHVAARIASCNEYAKSVELRRAEQSRGTGLILRRQLVRIHTLAVRQDVLRFFDVQLSPLWQAELQNQPLVELNKSTRFSESFRVISARSRKSLKVAQHADVLVKGVDCVLAELARVVSSRDTIREVLCVLVEELVLLEERDRWL